MLQESEESIMADFILWKASLHNEANIFKYYTNNYTKIKLKRRETMIINSKLPMYRSMI